VEGNFEVRLSAFQLVRRRNSGVGLRVSTFADEIRCWESAATATAVCKTQPPCSKLFFRRFGAGAGRAHFQNALNISVKFCSERHD
jgi:hypothetical protein